MRIIDSMLKDTALGTDGIKYYNHAPEPYAGIIPGEFPRIWVYDTAPEDVIQMNHTVKTKYHVIMEISDICQLSDKTETLEAAWERVHLLWIKFINRLSSHPSNEVMIGNVNRIEIVHKFGHNVVGYICRFTVQPFEINEYQCP